MKGTRGPDTFAGCIKVYPTPESLEAKVDEYFDWCFVRKYNSKLGREVAVEVHPPTLSGLARYLGFTSRGTLLNYKNDANPLFEDILSEARLRIEEYLESRLVTIKGNPAGIIFALKNNARWEEQTKTQLMGANNEPLVFGWASDAKDVLETSASTVNNALETSTADSGRMIAAGSAVGAADSSAAQAPVEVQVKDGAG